MTKLTLEQRIEIYKQMIIDFSLKEVEDRKSKLSDSGFCWWLSIKGTQIEDYPELMAQKPKSNYYFNSHFWWTRYTKLQNRRVKALKAALKLAKAKL